MPDQDENPSIEVSENVSQKPVNESINNDSAEGSIENKKDIDYVFNSLFNGDRNIEHLGNINVTKLSAEEVFKIKNYIELVLSGRVNNSGYIAEVIIYNFDLKNFINVHIKLLAPTISESAIEYWLQLDCKTILANINLFNDNIKTLILNKLSEGNFRFLEDVFKAIGNNISCLNDSQLNILFTFHYNKSNTLDRILYSNTGASSRYLNEINKLIPNEFMDKYYDFIIGKILDKRDIDLQIKIFDDYLANKDYGLEYIVYDNNFLTNFFNNFSVFNILKNEEVSSLTIILIIDFFIEKGFDVKNIINKLIFSDDLHKISALIGSFCNSTGFQNLNDFLFKTNYLDDLIIPNLEKLITLVSGPFSEIYIDLCKNKNFLQYKNKEILKSACKEKLIPKIDILLQDPESSADKINNLILYLSLLDFDAKTNFDYIKSMMMYNPLDSKNRRMIAYHLVNQNKIKISDFIDKGYSIYADLIYNSNSDSLVEDIDNILIKVMNIDSKTKFKTSQNLVFYLLTDCISPDIEKYKSKLPNIINIIRDYGDLKCNDRLNEILENNRESLMNDEACKKSLSKKYNFKAFKDNYNKSVKSLSLIEEVNQLLNSHIKDISKRVSGSAISSLTLLSNYLIQKEDYFFMSNINLLFSNNLLIFLEEKNKPIIEAYESYKNIPIALYALSKSTLDIRSDSPFNAFRRENKDLDSIFIENFGKKKENYFAQISQAPDQYLKYLEKNKLAASIMHYNGISANIIFNCILMPTFSLEALPNTEFLIILKNLKKIKFISDSYPPQFDRSKISSLLIQADEINEETAEKLNKDLIDTSILYKNFKIMEDPINKLFSRENISISNSQELKEACRRLYTDLGIIEDFQSIKEYIGYAKPKDIKLQDFNLKLNNNITFKVLDFLDPYAFRAGIDTNCCQRMYCAGENAAIDSFINPLASVLICYVNDTLISQSYFHYIPKDNGLILDNVEINKTNCLQLKIDPLVLSKIYADYAKKIKEKIPDINYITCGVDYNKINNDLFKTIGPFKQDPRHFEVESMRIGDKYTDCKGGTIDLLSPNKKLENINFDHIKQANYNYSLLKLAIRDIKLKMIFAKPEGISKSLVRMMWLERKMLK